MKKLKVLVGLLLTKEFIINYFLSSQKNITELAIPTF